MAANSPWGYSCIKLRTFLEAIESSGYEPNTFFDIVSNRYMLDSMNVNLSLYANENFSSGLYQPGVLFGQFCACRMTP